ncbi:MAG TPA: hypothetical protein VGI81_11560 [Tepidisphaeraceae bacterium]|jgi:aryl-alcohol dehydrogenase-like predicted oxidoreductase
MHSRPFGIPGVPVSEIGIGRWQFGSHWGDVSDEQAIATLNAAEDAEQEEKMSHR